MSERFFCDKCDKDITNLAQYQVYIYRKGSDKALVEMDLCPKCYAHIRNKADI